MDPKPWRTEFVLDTNGVRHILRDQFPELPVETVDYLHEGWDSTAFLINAEWVFRFPKRSEVEPWLQAERRVLELLRRLPLAIRIPQPEFVGKPNPLFPAAFMGYRWIPGTPGDHVGAPQVRQDECARQLGDFLSTLHAVDTESVARLNLRRYDDALDQLFAEVRTMRDEILASLPAPLTTISRDFIDSGVPIDALGAATVCLTHSDLGAEHLIFDDGGALAGVIDWGDVCVGDPAVDFAGIAAWLGEGFLRQVLAHYARPWDERFVRRILFAARCTALAGFGWSLMGWDAASDAPFAMIRTAFDVPGHDR